MNQRHALIAMVAVVLLSACSVFSPVKTEPTTTYVLNTTPAVRAHYPSHLTLLVSLPEANQIDDTKKMVYSLNHYQVAYFAKNGWAESPARMLQPLIVQTLQKTHYFHAIGTSMVGSHYDFILNTQLVKLQQNFYSNPSVVQVTLRAQLVRTSDARVIAAKEFTASEPAPQNNPYGGVLAANDAVADVLAQLARFVVRAR
jgi:cholesterol transport system auxiliary component